MASLETGVSSQASPEKQIWWSSKLTRHVSGNEWVAIKNPEMVDVSLRLFLFVFCFVSVVSTVTSKQTATIRVSPDMTIGVDAKFTHLVSLTYFVAAFSIVGLYSIITGYLSYSALKKYEPSSTNQQLHFVILDTLMLLISASATGAAGGVAYEAFKGNPHLRWMKICHIFDTFCHHLASAGAVSLLASVTLLMLVWFSVSAIVRNSRR